MTTSANYTVIVPGSAGGAAGMVGSYADSGALAAMTAALGAAPKMALTYVDSAQPLSNFLASGQYEASQFASLYGPNTIPLLGLPMAGGGENGDADFQAIANGSQDSMINGVLQAFADKGYKSFVLRPGFEMNGGWFSWTVNESNAADFKAAFQRIATLAHNFTGATVSVDFNPNVGPSIPLQDYYPGNAYVDSIGMDIYGQPWNSDTAPTDTNGSPTNLSLNYLMQFAKDNGKPFALPETGAGTADTLFPQQLVQAITAAHMPIAFAGLWDSNSVNNAQWTDNAAATSAWVAFANLVKQSSGGSASAGAITDASGNQWTITAGGQVAINGTVDPVTANVIELAYVNGTIWQENSAKLWWGETKPDGSWGNSPGTATSPLSATPPPPPPPPPPVTPSANDTVVMAGSTAAITDAAGNKWTITSGGQVATNGTVDMVTAKVIELAYVNGTIWQENSDKMWWGETKPDGSWANTPGTAISPLPVAVPPVTPPPPAPPSANDTVVKAGSTAAITDTAGNKWTITSGGQVATNGTIDPVTAKVIELAYVNGTIWQENSDKMWWGETKPDGSWANTPGTATSPLPVAVPPVTPPPPPSANYTVVKAGSTAAITDAAGNKWTITSGGQVAANSTIDPVTAKVIELAYVNGTIWQENSDKMWWGETKPDGSWANTPGTATSPLPTSITIPQTQASATVSLSQISVVATAGNHMVLIAGTGDTVKLSGGTDKITDTGGSNTYVIPAAGKGYDVFTSNILTMKDTLDLRTALAATKWTGTASTLAKYLSVADSATGAVLSIAPGAGGTGVAIASIGGATTANLTTLLAHAVT